MINRSKGVYGIKRGWGVVGWGGVGPLRKRLQLTDCGIPFGDTNPFAARLHDVVEQHESLVHVAPVLAVVVDAFPHHLHDLVERDHIVREVGDLGHQGGRGTPGVVGGGLPHLDLLWGRGVGVRGGIRGGVRGGFRVGNLGDRGRRGIPGVVAGGLPHLDLYGY